MGGHRVKEGVVIFLIATLFLCIFLSFTYITKPAHAVSSLQKVSASTAIDAKYSFSPRFIQGVTYLEGFGGNSYTADLWRWENNNYVELSSSAYYPIRVTSSSQKGKIGVWYRNRKRQDGPVFGRQGWEPTGAKHTKWLLPAD